MAGFPRRDYGLNRHRFGHCRRSSDAIVSKSMRRHGIGIIEIAPVDYDRILQLPVQAIQIQAGKLIPFGENQKSISSTSRFVGVTGVFDA